MEGKRFQVTGSKTRNLLQITQYTEAMCHTSGAPREVSHRVPCKEPIFMVSETWISAGKQHTHGSKADVPPVTQMCERPGVGGAMLQILSSRNTEFR